MFEYDFKFLFDNFLTTIQIGRKHHWFYVNPWSYIWPLEQVKKEMVPLSTALGGEIHVEKPAQIQPNPRENDAFLHSYPDNENLGKEAHAKTITIILVRHSCIAFYNLLFFRPCLFTPPPNSKFHRWGRWDTERFNDPCKVTQLTKKNALADPGLRTVSAHWLIWLPFFFLPYLLTPSIPLFLSPRQVYLWHLPETVSSVKEGPEFRVLRIKNGPFRETAP